jgi:hypothetical protein
MSERTDPIAAGHCDGHCDGRYDGHCVEHPADYAAAEPAPVPVLGPYIGVVGAVLCSLVGAFLLLAPYAFDYRDGVATVPHSSVVDLVTGGGVLLLGLATAALFGVALVRRLRAPAPAPDYYAEPLTLMSSESPESAEPTESVEAAEPVAAADGGAYAGAGAAAAPAGRVAPDRPAAPASEPEERPLAPAASIADPGGALRDLLTPLVAALAADLRARENGQSEGKSL